MDAKQYLLQIRKINALIRNKTIEMEQWRDVATGITARLDGERVQSSGKPSNRADAINSFIDLEIEIKRLEVQRQEIIRTIEQLNAAEYDVLHKRFVQGMTYREISAETGKKYDWVKQTVYAARKNVQRILDARMKNADFGRIDN